jgi:DNA-binding response OmpR family regulator
MSDATSLQSSDKNKRRVLLVEDNQITAMAYRNMLQREGFDVIHIASGNAALAAIRNQKFDVVLLDLMLPEIDGIEILKRNHSENKDFTTPVIVMSEVDLGMVREEVRRHGAKQFFTKTGADVQKVLESIKSLTGSSKGDKPAVPEIQFSHTVTETLRMASTPEIANRKISAVDCLGTGGAGQDRDNHKKVAGGRRRFLVLW